MARILAGLLVLLVILLGGGASYVYTGIRSFDVKQVTPDVHVILGWGGNVAVLRTEAGAVVVDTMTFRMQGERIRRLAEDLGGGPVQAVLNTHYHQDHTHGNPAFPAGARIVATRRTLEHLQVRDSAYWDGPAAETLPNETFSDRHEMSIGGKTIRSYHVGRGHTDGDLATLFVEDRVLVMGDLLFRKRYPRIDLEAGGSVREWDASLDRLLALDFDRVIPGHGAVTDAQGVREFQSFLRELWKLGSQAAAAGWSLERTLDEGRLTTDAGYRVGGIPLIRPLDRESVIREAWVEATGASQEGSGP